MGLKASVLSGLKWSAGGKFGTQLINWAFTILVIRLLQPDDYGLLALAAIFTSLCLLLNEMGLGAAIIQAKQLTNNLLRQAFGIILLLNGVLFISLFIAAPFIAELFSEPRLTDIIRFLALQFPIMAFYVIPNSCLTRDMDFKTISIVGIIADLLNGICTFTMAWFGFGVWSLVVGALVRVLTLCIGINIARPFLRWPSFNFRGFTDTAKYGGLISLHRILWYFYSQADVFIIGRILGSTILGFYSIAMQIASLPMQKIGSILSQVGLPAYSKIQEDSNIVANYSLKSSLAIGMVSFPVFFGISSIATVLVPVVLGDKWLMVILPLQLLSLVMPFRILSISLSPAVNGIGRPDINVKILAVACIIMPVSFLIGVQWGILGVSMAWIIAYSLWFTYMLTKVLPVLGLTMKRFFRVILSPLLFSIIMYGAVYLVRLFLEESELNQILFLIILSVTGALTYSGCMLLFRRDMCFDVINMFRKK